MQQVDNHIISQVQVLLIKMALIGKAQHAQFVKFWCVIFIVTMVLNTVIMWNPGYLFN